MRIERRQVGELIRPEVERLLKLTLPGGSMGPKLQQLWWLKGRDGYLDRRRLDLAYTLRAFDECGVLMGWALIEGRDPVFRVYVDKSYRRQGIAKALLERAITEDPGLEVIPWNRSSYEFFKPFVSSGMAVCAEHAPYPGRRFQ